MSNETIEIIKRMINNTYNDNRKVLNENKNDQVNDN